MFINKKGFTFIEVMIAMVIISMGLMAATSLYLMMAKNNRNANIITNSNYVLRTFVEELRGSKVLPQEGTFSVVRNGQEINYHLQPINNRSMRLTAETTPPRQRGKVISISTVINNWGWDGVSHTVGSIGEAHEMPKM